MQCHADRAGQAPRTHASNPATAVHENQEKLRAPINEENCSSRIDSNRHFFYESILSFT